MSDRNDPNRYLPGQLGTRILVNQSDLNQVDVPFDLGQINEVEGLLKDVRGIFTGIAEGSINVNQFDLNPVTDGVTTYAPKTASPLNATPGTSHGQVLAAKENRSELYIQNLSTGVLFVKLGAEATSDSFNFVLAGNTYNTAGDGGSVFDQGYTGVVSVTGGFPAKFIAWDR